MTEDFFDSLLAEDIADVEMADQETEDAREKLAILVASGKSKEMVGKALTHEEVKRMSCEDVKKYAIRYETAIASRTTDALAESFLKLTTKLVGMALPIDSVEALQNDLVSDYIINNELRTLCGSLSLRCGRLMAMAVGALHVARHVDVTSIPKCQDSEEPTGVDAHLNVGMQEHM